MTTSSVPASLPQLRAVSVSLDGHRAEIDGIRFRVRYEINPGDLYGGKADVEIYQDGTPVVVDRAEWDEAHPGVEPTVAAMASVFNDAAFDLSEQARGAF